MLRPASLAVVLITVACARHEGAVHWSYEGAGGPSHWGDLSPEFKTCSTGTRQSPIDLSQATRRDMPDPIFRYKPSGLNLLNNGHTLQVQYDAGSEMEVEGARYALAQFHVHAPSEHTVNGKAAPAEVHLVHRAADNALAVVGVLIDEGGENSALKPVLSDPPSQEGPVQTRSATVDASALLPASRGTYRYAGSLTTPPCSEGVRWFVMTERITMSGAQIAALTKLFHDNHRPVQPLNGRMVAEDRPPR